MKRKDGRGQYTVRWYSAEEREKLLCALERMEFNLTGIRRYPNYKYVKDAPNSYTIQLPGSLYPLRPLIGAAMVSSGGRIYMVDEFIKLMDMDDDIHPRFPVFHIPHDGHKFPDELMRGLCISQGEFLKYHLKMSDKDISRVLPGVYQFHSHKKQFEISRLLCDVERFEDEKEPMVQFGMGICYTNAYDGKKLRNVADEMKESTLKYYNQHHKMMNDLCKRYKRLLIIDLHSFAEDIVPSQQKTAGYNMPDLCIGTDSVFTPDALIKTVRCGFEGIGFSTELNYPYKGTYIPHALLSGESECDCIGIMLEFNKRTYLMEDGSPNEEGIVKIQEAIKRIMLDCLEL